MNKCILTGNLAKDPEVRSTQSGKTCATFDLAVQRAFRDRETGKRECDFIRCVAWGQTAEYISSYCGKGHRIGVDGSIQVRSWEGNDGVKHWATEVIVDRVESLQGRSENAAQNPAQAAAEALTGGLSGFVEVNDDRLPF